jgi:hypothetical protein
VVRQAHPERTTCTRILSGLDDPRILSGLDDPLILSLSAVDVRRDPDAVAGEEEALARPLVVRQAHHERTTCPRMLSGLNDPRILSGLDDPLILSLSKDERARGA